MLTADKLTWKNILILTVALIFSGGVFAETDTIPPLVNYQGKLTDSGGADLPTGEYDLYFRIWNDREGKDTTTSLIWGAKYEKVPVVRGMFNVILGAGVPLEGLTDAQKNISNAFTEGNRFLGVTINTADVAAEIAPRQQFLSAPYALQTKNAMNATLMGNQEPHWWVPVGSVIAYFGKNAPEGWILCDGQSIKDKEEYAPLRTLLGSDNVPDLRGLFLRGAGQNSQKDYRYEGDDGREPGTAQEDAFEKHAHKHTHAVWLYFTQKDSTGAHIEGAWADGGRYDINCEYDESNPSSGTNKDETRPNNTAVNYIIKY